MLNFPRSLHKLYKFENEGALYIADLERGTVVKVDEIIWDILEVCSDYTTAQILKSLADKYSHAEICARIDQLERFNDLGLFFSDDEPLTLPTTKVGGFSVEFEPSNTGSS